MLDSLEGGSNIFFGLNRFCMFIGDCRAVLWGHAFNKSQVKLFELGLRNQISAKVVIFVWLDEFE
jgi:hypothetical protein